MWFWQLILTIPNRLPQASVGFWACSWMVPLWIIAVGTSLASEPTPVEPSTATTVSFTNDILPIFRQSCLACHHQKAKEGGVVLESVATILQGGDSGQLVIPGNATESLLFSVAAYRSEPVMPPEENEANAPKLTPKQLGLLQAWINAGARADTNQKKADALPWQAIPSHLRAVYATALSPDLQRAAFSRGNRVFVYDTRTGNLLAQLAANRTGSVWATDYDLVQALAFSADGQWLSTGGFRNVKLWQRTTTITAEPTDAYLNPPILSTEEVEQWRFVRQIGQPENRDLLVDRVLALAFIPNPPLLIVGGGEPARSGEIKAFSITTGELQFSVPDPHTDTVLALAVSPSGDTFAAAAADKMIKIFRLAEPYLVRQFEGHTGHVTAISWSSDGQYLFSAGADLAIKQWRVPTGERIQEWQPFSKGLIAVHFLAKHQAFLTAASHAQLALFAFPSGSKIRTYEGLTGYLHAATVSRDGSLLLAGNHSGDVYLWEVETGKVKQHWPNDS